MLRRSTRPSFRLSLAGGVVALGGLIGAALAPTVPGTASAWAASSRMAERTGSAATVTLPKASGGFGQAPKITFPAGGPPKTLQTEVLHKGTGPVVHKGDLLVADYLGQLWKGKVFDSSYVRPAAAGFAIGVGQVVPGWDKALVGVRAGSRLLLVLPPADGYGKAGAAQAGIPGNETLVFVVDVISSYSKAARASGRDTFVKHGVGGIMVSGSLGAAPKIAIAKGTPQPSKATTTVLERGSGPKVTRGLVVLQFSLVDWTAKVRESTWQAGTPFGATVGIASQPSGLDSLVGIPIGSRVLVQAPKTSTGGPFAIAIDLVAQPKRPTSNK